MPADPTSNGGGTMLDRRLRCAAAMAAICAVPALTVPQARAAPAAVKAAARPAKGSVIAHIRIKRMGLKMVVRQGVGQEVLRRGVGHYPGTAFPGREGNTVLLAHRTTWLHPF